MTVNRKFIRKNEGVTVTILIKILTNYLNILSCLNDLDLQLPSDFENVTMVVGSPVYQTTISLECTV